MKETLVGFKTAKLAKKKGFPQIFLHFQYINLKEGEWKLYSSTDADELDNSIGIGESIRCSAPTQSLLQKWLRDIHGILVLVDHETSKGWYYRVYVNNSEWSTGYKTYEEALEEGLLEALKLI